MCPNQRLLKTYKVYPKLHEFQYLRENFFIYIYMNPFREYDRPYNIKVQGLDFCMAYEPLYVGKGSNGNGYRQNQHIQAFLSDKEQNSIKTKWFKYLDEQMKKAQAMGDHTKPWNWKEYQKDWINVVRTFPTAQDLLKFEVEMIQKIGTKWDGTGPLVNKIKN